jgi:hypothetical protein
MTGRLATAGLVGLAAGLGWLNWHIANTAIDVSPMMPTGGASAQGATRIRLPSRPLVGTKLESFSETTARPVFSATRRPPVAAPVAPPPPVVVAKPEPAPLVTPPEGLRLAGIMQGASGPSALIVTKADPNGRWCQLNGEVEGWRLTAIQPGVVQMEARGARYELKLY